MLRDVLYACAGALATFALAALAAPVHWALALAYLAALFVLGWRLRAHDSPPARLLGLAARYALPALVPAFGLAALLVGLAGPAPDTLGPMLAQAAVAAHLAFALLYGALLVRHPGLVFGDDADARSWASDGAAGQDHPRINPGTGLPCIGGSLVDSAGRGFGQGFDD